MAESKSSLKKIHQEDFSTTLKFKVDSVDRISRHLETLRSNSRQNSVSKSKSKLIDQSHDTLLPEMDPNSFVVENKNLQLQELEYSMDRKNSKRKEMRKAQKKLASFLN